MKGVRNVEEFAAWRYAEQLERERRARSKLKKADKNQVPRTLYEAAGESKIDFFVMKPHVQ